MPIEENTADLSNLLSIIVPTYNEENSIETLLRQIQEHLPLSEVIVVDAGTDSTLEKALKIQKEWPGLVVQKQALPAGKGSAIRQGIQLASKAFIAQLDSDLQFYAEDLLPMTKLLQENQADLVCGSRFLHQSKRFDRSVPGLRDPGNRAVSFYTSFLTGKKQTDVLAGIKVWRREVSESFTLRSNDFCYEAEIPVKALRNGFRIIDFPVKTRAREHGESSVNTWKTGFSLLKEIPRFKWGRC